MKKLLILSNKVPYPSQDGSSIAMARLLEDLLALQTIEITYGALNTTKHYKDPKDFPAPIAQAINLEVFNVNTSPSISSALNNLCFSCAPYHSIRFFVRPMIDWLRGFEDNQFDFVLLEGAFMGDYLNEVQRVGRHCTLRAHNLEHRIWERTSEAGINPLKNWYLTLQSKRLRKFEIGLVANVDSVWSISEEDKKWFEKINPKTTTIAVSIVEQELLSNLTPLTCFHLGALDWEPNLQGLDWFLTSVWPRVLKKIPNATFHIAGNNPPQRLQSEQSKNYAVHGRVPDAEEFAKSHGVAVVPLLAGSGIRIKMIMNASWAIPMVSTRIGAEGLFNESNRGVLLADSAEEFASALIELLTSPKNAATLGMQANRYILSGFGPESIQKNIASAWSI
ncbi:glycosyltransferase family 4 protein [Schleiferiaceae bacterium]|nr:glycosyltransferase family 4 protein [Schleiferiaceae bacterium]